MKKISIILLLILSTGSTALGQIQKKNLLVGISTKLSTPYSRNSKTNISPSAIEISPEINYALSPNFLLGFGANMGRTSIDAKILSFPWTLFRTTLNLSSKNIAGFFQLKYTNKLTKKLYWNLTLRGSYGNLTENLSLNKPIAEVIIEPNYQPYILELNLDNEDLGIPLTTNSGPVSSTNVDVNYHSVSLTPQLVYFPHKRLAFQFDMGGLEFISSMEKSLYGSKDSQLLLNVKPTNWGLSVFYTFGKVE
jgi:hypothetical protein